ncbi:MAG: hypothetical protein ACRDP6_24605 [Actinoallomurus sp.]
MPEPVVLHVEPAWEPWDVAVDAVCSSLGTYAAYRLLSGDIPARARRAARTTSQTEAVPGPGRPETAHEAHDTEKGIAP